MEADAVLGVVVAFDFVEGLAAAVLVKGEQDPDYPAQEDWP